QLLARFARQGKSSGEVHLAAEADLALARDGIVRRLELQRRDRDAAVADLALDAEVLDRAGAVEEAGYAILRAPLHRFAQTRHAAKVAHRRVGGFQPLQGALRQAQGEAAAQAGQRAAQIAPLRDQTRVPAEPALAVPLGAGEPAQARRVDVVPIGVEAH